MPTETGIYRFDDVVLDTTGFRLTKGDDAVTLTPRAFDVLMLLIEERDRVVERREIFDRVWRDTFVSDNALSKVVKEIRHVLGDSADEPKYIETIQRRGYRFIAEIESEADEAADEAASAGSPDARGKSRPRSLLILAILVIAVATIASFSYLTSRKVRKAPSTIAVLPFKPLDTESRDLSLEYGMAETLATRLSGLREIVVKPTSYVQKAAENETDPLKVGVATQSEAVLDGTIQRSGERVRISVRLIDVASGETLWSEHFDETFTHIFDVQDAIAERITHVLAIRLEPREQQRLARHATDDPAAYEAYLRGQFLWNRRGPGWVEQTLAAYTDAVDRDPNFALAHIGMADAYIMQSGHGDLSMDEAEVRAEPHIMRALEIDNELAEGHNALAELKYQYKYDWAGASKEFERAVELGPNSAWIRQAYGWFLMSEGKFDEAAAQMDRARELDPSSLTINVGRGRLYYYSRQFEKSIAHFKEVIASEPNDPSVYTALSEAFEGAGRYDEAFEAGIRAKEVSGVAPKAIDEMRAVYASGGWQGFFRWRIEKLTENARTGQVPHGALANAYLRIGDNDKALDHFAAIFREHDVLALQFKINPAYDPIRNDPRYVGLLNQVGLDP